MKRLAGKIDRVLVDAPCTGFGTLRRNPDLKWRQTPNDLAELTAKQARDPRRRGDARQARRPRRLRDVQRPARGERCDRRRLSRRASEFAQKDASAELARAEIALDTGPALRLCPHRHGCDGFYAAILERVG